MKPKERQLAILDYLQVHGKTSVEQLSEHFLLTGATIRKDLTILENANKVIRTYGSVVLVNNEEIDLPITNKANINLEIKKKIARAAINLLKDGDSIIFDAGSTVLQMVPFLTQLANLTIMTNSLHIINGLANLDSSHELLICGGTFRYRSGSFHGVLAESTFEHFTFDKLFVGTDGFDLNVGLTTFNEVHGVSKSMCAAAKEIIVLADSSKFGRRSPNLVCPLEKINVVITDNNLNPEIYESLLDKGIKVILVN